MHDDAHSHRAAHVQVFALLDSNDQARDAVLSKHVLAQHRGEHYSLASLIIGSQQILPAFRIWSDRPYRLICSRAACLHSTRPAR